MVHHGGRFLQLILRPEAPHAHMYTKGRATFLPTWPHACADACPAAGQDANEHIKAVVCTQVATIRNACRVSLREAHQYSWSLDPRHLVIIVSGCCWQSLPPKTLRKVDGSNRRLTASAGLPAAMSGSH